MRSSILEEDALSLVVRKVFNVGSNDEGEFRRRGAPGHPH